MLEGALETTTASYTFVSQKLPPNSLWCQPLVSWAPGRPSPQSRCWQRLFRSKWEKPSEVPPRLISFSTLGVHHQEAERERKRERERGEGGFAGGFVSPKPSPRLQSHHPGHISFGKRKLLMETVSSQSPVKQNHCAVNAAHALPVSARPLVYHEHNQIHSRTSGCCLGFPANAFLQCLPFMF